MTGAKVIMLALSAVFSLCMPALSGAGLIYNKASYGAELERVGIFLIAAAVMMTAGAVLCLIRKNLTNIISIILTSGGFALCMTMLHKLTEHADKSGWSDKYTMTPISDMYRSRVMPCIAPAALALVIAVVQLMSYELSEQRRERRRRKKELENAPAPSVLGNDDERD